MKFLPTACLLLMIACKGTDKKKAVYTGKGPDPIATYSQAIRVGNTLYVSGQIALGQDGRLDTSSIAGETRQIMNNLKAIVEAGNMQMSDVAKCTIYLTDLKYFYAVNEVYGGYFPSDPPARETVQVQALPRCAHVEISLVAQQ